MPLKSLILLLQAAATIAETSEQPMREARSAQARFESFRRAHLPTDWSVAYHEPCDAVIGRYCYWYDSTKSNAVPEPERISEARAKLIVQLESAWERAPSEGWIVGQLVRYLVEAGGERADRAVAVARACRAEPWWCRALEGLALHTGQRYAASDSVYALALESMPEERRCGWLDISRLVGGETAREISRSGCDGRVALTKRLWKLGQPLWSTSGNDLRTEHFARMTMSALLANSASAHGMSWGADSHELLMRYGWAEWFTRSDRPATASFASAPGVVGHDREPSYHFFPALGGGSIRGTPVIPPGSWQLRAPGSLSRYAPRHIDRMVGLDHQLSRFPRGDSTLLVVAFDITDTALTRDSISGFMAVLDKDSVRIAPLAWERVMTIVAARDTVVVSAEVVGDRSRVAARARYSVAPIACARLCLSDILLFEPGVDEPGEITDAIPRALATDRIATSNTVGAAWEAHGPAEPRSEWIAIAVEPVRVSLARRIASRLKLTEPPAALRLRWPAAVQEAAQFRSVVLRLPREARGRYRVTLTVQRGSETASSSREVTLIR